MDFEVVTCHPSEIRVVAFGHMGFEAVTYHPLVIVLPLEIAYHPLVTTCHPLVTAFLHKGLAYLPLETVAYLPLGTTFLP